MAIIHINDLINQQPDQVQNQSKSSIIPIQDLMSGTASTPKKNVLQGGVDAIGAVIKDFGDAAKGVGYAVTHPVDVAKSVGTALFDHPVDNLKNFVGQKIKDYSPGNIQDTLRHPFTKVIPDLSLLSGGAGAVIGKAGELAGSQALINVGKGMVKTSMVPMEAAGQVLENTGKTVIKGINAIPQGLKKSSYGLMNGIVNQLPKEFRYGQNAGRGAVKEGITGSSADEIAQKATDKINQIGGEGDAIAAKVTKTDNYNDSIKVINDKISELQQSSPRTNKASIERLYNAKDDLLQSKYNANGKLISQKNLSNMTPTEALDFKRRYNAITQWTGSASDDKLVNATLQNSRRVIKDKLNANVPDLAEWNNRYGDLSVLQTAARREAIYQEAGKGIGDKISNGLRAAGGASVVWNLAHGNIGGIAESLALMGVKEVIGSATVRSNVAQLLYKASELDKAKLFKAVPWLKAHYSNIVSNIQNQINPVNKKMPVVNKKIISVPNKGYNPQVRVIRAGPTYPPMQGTKLGKDLYAQNLKLNEIPLHPAKDAKNALNIIYSKSAPENVARTLGIDVKHIPSDPTYPPMQGTELGKDLYSQGHALNEIPLHPSKDAKNALNIIYSKSAPENVARTLGIDIKHIPLLEDIKGLFDVSEKGTNHGVSYGKGGKQLSESTYWGTASNSPIKDISQFKQASIIGDILKGKKPTPGEVSMVKRLIEHFKSSEGIAPKGTIIPSKVQMMEKLYGKEKPPDKTIIKHKKFVN